MKLLAPLLFVLLFLFFESLWAKSCKAPQIDNSVLYQSKIVAKGKIIKQKRGLSGADSKAPKDYIEISTFKIINAWKGTNKGQSIRVFRNTYWGDNQNIGQEFFLILRKNNSGQYTSSACNGGTFEVNKNNKDLIKKYFKGRP